MISIRLSQLLACATLIGALSSCGMFGSGSSQANTAPSAQEFDPFSNSWKPAGQIVTPPPSEPNAALAEQKAEQERQSSALNKVGRAVGNTASAAGRVVKKPLEWLPFGKKDEAPVEEVKPAAPAKAQ
jgi:hypothetical protein